MPAAWIRLHTVIRQFSASLLLPLLLLLFSFLFFSFFFFFFGRVCNQQYTHIPNTYMIMRYVTLGCKDLYSSNRRIDIRYLMKYVVVSWLWGLEKQGRVGGDADSRKYPKIRSKGKADLIEERLMGIKGPKLFQTRKLGYVIQTSK